MLTFRTYAIDEDGKDERRRIDACSSIKSIQHSIYSWTWNHACHIYTYKYAHTDRRAVVWMLSFRISAVNRDKFRDQVARMTKFYFFPFLFPSSPVRYCEFSDDRDDDIESYAHCVCIVRVSVCACIMADAFGKYIINCAIVERALPID